MPTVMVRVGQESHEVLKELSARAGRPMPEILAAAIEQYRRTQFLTATNKAYGRLRKNPKAWRNELLERRAWDKTLLDGLENG